MVSSPLESCHNCPGDTIFSPGGTMSNLYAVNAARHHIMPRCKPLGMADCPQMVMFTSQEAHYSTKVSMPFSFMMSEIRVRRRFSESAWITALA